jgi:hypothetical protein
MEFYLHLYKTFATIKLLNAVLKLYFSTVRTRYNIDCYALLVTYGVSGAIEKNDFELELQSFSLNWWTSKSKSNFRCISCALNDLNDGWIPSVLWRQSLASQTSISVRLQTFAVWVIVSSIFAVLFVLTARGLSRFLRVGGRADLFRRRQRRAEAPPLAAAPAFDRRRRRGAAWKLYFTCRSLNA